MKKNFFNSKNQNILSIGIVLVLVGVVILGLLPPSIAMKNDGLKIGGLYGKLYEWQEIENVKLLSQSPKIGLRTNGMDLGSIRRGYFKMDGYGSSTLYLNMTHAAFIVFEYGDKSIFISFESDQKAKEAYESILEFSL